MRSCCSATLQYGFYANIVDELRLEDTGAYKEMTRMNYDTFLTLLSFIEPYISPQDTYFGTKPIKADERLTITIRFLGTGETFRSLHFQFRIGYNTPPTAADWLKISELFYLRWDYPHCLGAIDGKHVLIAPPPNSCSQYYNYKKYSPICVEKLTCPLFIQIN